MVCFDSFHLHHLSAKGTQTNSNYVSRPPPPPLIFPKMFSQQPWWAAVSVNYSQLQQHCSGRAQQAVTDRKMSSSLFLRLHNSRTCAPFTAGPPEDWAAVYQQLHDPESVNILFHFQLLFSLVILCALVYSHYYEMCRTLYSGCYLTMSMNNADEKKNVDWGLHSDDINIIKATGSYGV